MKKLIKGLQEFQTRYYSSHKDLFEQLSQGQHPRVLFIACSDSRVDPNLITNTEPGELFVIRNAGNIIPPYEATDGGEGAAVEYAIHALDIQQIIVCGHSHCGAMKGLLKLNSLEEEMPLVYEWLKHAEATRRLIKDHYGDHEGEDLLDATIAENVLTQIENLRTHPVIHSKLYSGQLSIHGWIYYIETGQVLAYDAEQHQFLPPSSQIDLSRKEVQSPAKLTQKQLRIARGTSSTAPEDPLVEAPSNSSSWLSPEQANRIYRGSSV